MDEVPGGHGEHAGAYSKGGEIKNGNEMTDEEIIGWLQQVYRERGFLVVACRFPKDIGEVLSLEDSYLPDTTRWRVVGASSAEELRPQLRGHYGALERPYFYRAEAMD